MINFKPYRYKDHTNVGNKYFIHGYYPFLVAGCKKAGITNAGERCNTCNVNEFSAYKASILRL